MRDYVTAYERTHFTFKQKLKYFIRGIKDVIHRTTK